MAALHLVSRSPAESRALEQCLARAGEGDAVLLIEDGVYAAAAGSVSNDLLRAAAGQVAIYVLIPDMEARGLEIGNHPPQEQGRKNSPQSSAWAPAIRLIDYQGFVALTTAYHPIVSWF